MNHIFFRKSNKTSFMAFVFLGIVELICSIYFFWCAEQPLLYCVSYLLFGLTFFYLGYSQIKYDKICKEYDKICKELENLRNKELENLLKLNDLIKNKSQLPAHKGDI